MSRSNRQHHYHPVCLVAGRGCDNTFHSLHSTSQLYIIVIAYKAKKATIHGINFNPSMHCPQPGGSDFVFYNDIILCFGMRHLSLITNEPKCLNGFLNLKKKTLSMEWCLAENLTSIKGVFIAVRETSSSSDTQPVHQTDNQSTRQTTSPSNRQPVHQTDNQSTRQTTSQPDRQYFCHPAGFLPDW